MERPVMTMWTSMFYCIVLLNTSGAIRICAYEDAIIYCGQIDKPPRLLAVYWKLMGTTVSSYMHKNKKGILTNKDSNNYIMDNATFALTAKRVKGNITLQCEVVYNNSTSERSRNIEILSQPKLSPMEGCSDTICSIIFDLRENLQLMCTANNVDQEENATITWTSSQVDVISYASVTTYYNEHVLTSTISVDHLQSSPHLLQYLSDLAINCTLDGHSSCGHNQFIMYTIDVPKDEPSLAVDLPVGVIVLLGVLTVTIPCLVFIIVYRWRVKEWEKNSKRSLHIKKNNPEHSKDTTITG